MYALNQFDGSGVKNYFRNHCNRTDLENGSSKSYYWIDNARIIAITRASTRECFA